jgi:hypothetical protein
MGHPMQMAGPTVQNFVSAAVGLAATIALVRGFARLPARPAGRPGTPSRPVRACWCAQREVGRGPSGSPPRGGKGMTLGSASAGGAVRSPVIKT